MGCVTATAILQQDVISSGAALIRDEISVSAGVVCTIGDNNVLWASDGVLYDSTPEPIFTTE